MTDTTAGQGPALSEGLGPLPEPDATVEGVPLYMADSLRDYALEQVAAERERCAKLAEGAQHLSNDGKDFANGWCSAAAQIAQAIRMSGGHQRPARKDTMAQIKREDMRVGHWWALCCLHDLQQVQDEEDIATIMDQEGMFRGGWDTCAEAVDELIQECDREERLFLLRWYRGGGENPAIANELARYVTDDA